MATGPNTAHALFQKARENRVRRCALSSRNIFPIRWHLSIVPTKKRSPTWGAMTCCVGPRARGDCHSRVHGTCGGEESAGGRRTPSAECQKRLGCPNAGRWEPFRRLERYPRREGKGSGAGRRTPAAQAGARMEKEALRLRRKLGQNCGPGGSGYPGWGCVTFTEL
jgi:hypothetical protein